MINPDEIVLNCHEGRDDRDWIYPEMSVSTVQDAVFSRRASCPNVVNQGSIGSCVGQSGRVVFGEVEVNRPYELSSMCIYKTAQLYDIWEGEDYSGTSVSGACKGLYKDGVCLEKYWPYGNEEGNLNYEDDAATRKIHSYYRISLKRVEEIKELLKKECLWLSMKVYNNFYYVGPHGIVQEDGYIESGYSGGHAMAIIGYKQTAEGLFWEVQNSWGVHWGDKGYCYIPHSLLLKIIKGQLYVLITTEEHQQELEAKKKEEELKRQEEERRKKEEREQYLKSLNPIQRLVVYLKEFLNKLF